MAGRVVGSLVAADIDAVCSEFDKVLSLRLCGRAGRLTTKRGGFRPGQVSAVRRPLGASPRPFAVAPPRPAAPPAAPPEPDRTGSARLVLSHFHYIKTF